MKNMNYYDIYLSRIDISNENKLKLLKKFGSAELILKQSKSELLNEGFEEKTVDKILNSDFKNMKKYIDYMNKNDIKIISCTQNNYPTILNQISNKPVYIYVRGNIQNLYGDNIAIVGSREATDYGKKVSRKIAKELADKGINIVSGLAVGIDKYAHLGALDSKIGKTIAVLGTGISDFEVYPYENKKLFERILKEGGTIVSEFCLGSKPMKYHFPLRNRIISGLSKKVIIVEAGSKSGSLITVDYALDQGKDIYAVPGNITSKQSEGTNYLLFEGANILNKIEDIF